VSALKLFDGEMRESRVRRTIVNRVFSIVSNEHLVVTWLFVTELLLLYTCTV